MRETMRQVYRLYTHQRLIEGVSSWLHPQKIINLKLRSLNHEPNLQPVVPFMDCRYPSSICLTLSKISHPQNSNHEPSLQPVNQTTTYKWFRHIVPYLPPPETPPWTHIMIHIYFRSIRTLCAPNQNFPIFINLLAHPWSPSMAHKPNHNL